ncbi:MAG TPA: hypothetical protein VFV19_15315 [Candidatus Polarisedimenticolaceae bacterium]|nr:hypothetical protein [Candidatus Polarisedimenticolaceae bacterium]
MTKKIVLGLAIVAVAALVAMPASASCIPGKSAQSFNVQAGQYAYWTSTSTDGNLLGLTWQLGAPGTWNGNGGVVNCNTFSWMYFSPAGANVNLDLGSCGSGCPANGSTLAVLGQHQPAGSTKTNFILATVVETPANTVNFDYSAQGNHNFVELSRPHVVSSSRAGSTVNLNLSLPSIAGGLYGPNAASAVTGYVVRSVSASARPDRNAASYGTVLGTFPASGGVAASAAVGVDCSNIANDQWVVTQLSFEGGAVVSQVVSEPTQVKCNPALADPKFKIVPKKAGSLNPNN